MKTRNINLIENKDLIQKVINSGFIPINVNQISISNKILLENNLDLFLSSIKSFKQKNVFYQYTFYDENNYLIPIDTDWYCEQEESVRSEVDDHNKKVLKYDFSRPKYLIVFIINEGTLIGIELKNYWCEENNITSANKTINKIEDNYYNKIRPVNKEAESELREIIFKDPEFKYCKNQDLRYWYLVDLLEKENMDKYKGIVSPYGVSVTGKVKMFMDKTWMLYKENKL